MRATGHLLARRPARSHQGSALSLDKDIDIGSLQLRAVILTFVSPLAAANSISRRSELIQLLR